MGVTGSARQGRRALLELARLYGAQTAYYDVARRRRVASPEALVRVLQALGAPIAALGDVPAALRERRQALWRRGTEPVIMAWDGGPVRTEVRVPASDADGVVTCHLRRESGEASEWQVGLDDAPALRVEEVEGVRYVAKGLVVPGSLPLGLHRLTVQRGAQHWESAVIAAPGRTFGATHLGRANAWGVFLPLYALHSRRSWGAGDIADLEALVEWTASLNGQVVGTLPLLAQFLDVPFEPSPYAPVSRLFWNELYLDVTRLPEFERSTTAQALMASPAFQDEIGELRSRPYADYRRQMGAKRKVLQELATCLFQGPSERQAELRRYVAANPAAEDYARFRAACERQRVPWPSWPEPLRSGTLTPGDYDGEVYRYHLYVQWAMQEQLASLVERARGRGVQLYLDLPLGVHPHGYDVWRERAIFAHGVSAGAPPDSFFTKGQDWGFPPLHPERLRDQGYRYLVACLEHHLRLAGLLRVDHIMGLHRLFWVPNGMEPRDGVYVRYPAEELYAVLGLLSHRYRSAIVGEDLGTVPRYVRAAMGRHGVRRSYVLQYEVSPRPERALATPPRRSVAALNTHDMPLFAAFWRGRDIEDRRDLGLLDEEGVRESWAERHAIRQALARFLVHQGFLREATVDERDALRACLGYLAASPARTVLVNLEDLWLEEQPQNVPGTAAERPNWRRRARYGLEEFIAMADVVGVLRWIAKLRRGERAEGESAG